MASPIVTLLAACQAALADVAPNFEGSEWLAAAHCHPRYVWVVNGADAQNANAIGGNPRSLANDFWQVDVHCWGEDFAQAVALREGLITAVRQTVNGKNYGIAGTRVQSNGEHTMAGFVLVVSLTILTPLPEVSLPTLAQAIKLTHRPTSVDIDASTAVASDGTLDAPNEA